MKTAHYSPASAPPAFMGFHISSRFMALSYTVDVRRAVDGYDRLVGRICNAQPSHDRRAAPHRLLAGSSLLIARGHATKRRVAVPRSLELMALAIVGPVAGAGAMFIRLPRHGDAGPMVPATLAAARGLGTHKAVRPGRRPAAAPYPPAAESPWPSASGKSGWPRCAGAEKPQHAIQDATLGDRWASRLGLLRGEQRLKQLPWCVAAVSSVPSTR
jgi:hypothetical protein